MPNAKNLVELYYDLGDISSFPLLLTSFTGQSLFPFNSFPNLVVHHHGFLCSFSPTIPRSCPKQILAYLHSLRFFAAEDSVRHPLHSISNDSLWMIFRCTGPWGKYLESTCGALYHNSSVQCPYILDHLPFGCDYENDFALDFSVDTLKS